MFYRSAKSLRLSDEERIAETGPINADGLQSLSVQQFVQHSTAVEISNFDIHWGRLSESDLPALRGHAKPVRWLWIRWAVSTALMSESIEEVWHLDG